MTGVMMMIALMMNVVGGLYSRSSCGSRHRVSRPFQQKRGEEMCRKQQWKRIVWYVMTFVQYIIMMTLDLLLKDCYKWEFGDFN